MKKNEEQLREKRESLHNKDLIFLYKNEVKWNEVTN